MATFNDFREKHIKYVHDSAWGIIAAGTEKHTNHFGFFLPNSVIDANMIEMDDFLCPELPIHGFLTIYGFFLKLQKIKEEEGGLSEEEQKLFSLTSETLLQVKIMNRHRIFLNTKRNGRKKYLINQTT